MKILIIPNYEKEKTAEVLTRVLEVIEAYNNEYEIIDLSDETQIDGINAEGDIVLYIGGDGTFIRSAKLAYRSDIPIVGINTGKVGYLSKIHPFELREKLGLLMRNEYTTISAEVLRLKYSDKVIEPIINDIVLQSKVNLSDFVVEEKGDRIFESRASALVISTAVGSTGINKSAGGAVIMPDGGVMCITPILVQSGDSHCLICRGNGNYLVDGNTDMGVCVDGEHIFTVNEPLEVEFTQKKLKIVKLKI